MSVNKVILVGRLGQNPELRHTPSGAAVAHFSIATNENWTDKSGQKQNRTEWHRIVVWSKLADLCAKYLTKGREVYLEGRLQTRQWQDQSGQTRYTTEIQAQTVQFLGGGQQAQANGEAPEAREVPAFDAAPEGAPQAGPSGGASLTDEDIPF